MRRRVEISIAERTRVRELASVPPVSTDNYGNPVYVYTSAEWPRRQAAMGLVLAEKACERIAAHSPWPPLWFRRRRLRRAVRRREMASAALARATGVDG